MSRGNGDDDDVPIDITPDILEGSLEDRSEDRSEDRLQDRSEDRLQDRSDDGLQDDSLEPAGASEPGPGVPGADLPGSDFAGAIRVDPREQLLELGAELELAEGPAAAPLLYQIGELQQTALEDGDAALASYREALARDPTFVAALGPLREILAARADWSELVALLERQVAVAPLAAPDRADLLVERGRILEDRLARPAEAAAAYRAALELAPEHLPALLALLLIALRTSDGAGIEAALAGLVHAADDPERRAALSVELARVQRRSAPEGTPAGAADGAPAAADGASGAERALATVRDALAALDGRPAVPALVGELERLALRRDLPRVQIGALEELARHAPPGEAARQAALHRQKARLLRDVLGDPAGALEALAEARRRWPEHPLLDTEMLDLADQLGRVLPFETFDGPLASETIDRLVEALWRSGRAAEALQASRDHGDSSPPGAAAAALRIALLAETGDALGLAEAFEAEGTGARGPVSAHALVRAATVRDGILQDPRRAEALYRAAMAAEPGYRPAIDALEERLRGAGRWSELAELLESELALPDGDEPVGEPPRARRRYLLETLVGLRRDRLDQPARALQLQREVVALDPDDLRAWIGQRDLELAVALAGPGGAPAAREEVATLIELAARAGQPAVRAALEIEAARASQAPPAGPEDRRAAEALWRQARGHDRSGLAAGGLEGALNAPADRADALASELAAADAAGSAAVARALRYRLAALHASEGRLKQALAVLRPSRAAGDELAWIWSHDRARRSGDPALELALLAEPGADEPRAAPARAASADRGEALERAGDPEGARLAFRGALVARPSLDVALGLLRTAAATPTGDLPGVAEALRAISELSVGRDDGGGDRLAAAARREAELLDAARGGEGPVRSKRPLVAVAGVATMADPGHPALAIEGERVDDDTDVITVAPAAHAAAADGDGEDAEDGHDGGGGDDRNGDLAGDRRPGQDPDLAVARWMTGVQTGDHRRAARALIDLAADWRATTDPAGAPPTLVAPLLVRAAARARVAGRPIAEAVHRTAWSAAAGSAALAHSLSDLRGWDLAPALAAALPDTRSARANRVSPASSTLASALDLERALEEERSGRLGEALDAYGRVLARDPERLEAMAGVRRVARAGGDVVGEARALARLATLVKTPLRAGALFAEAAPLYERAGRIDEAIACYLKVLEHLPDDQPVFERVMRLLRARADAPGNAKTLDRLLSHRIHRRTGQAGAEEAIALLSERAHNRLRRLDDRENAAEDWKRILKIDGGQPDALRQLATLAIELRYPADAAPLLERYLMVVRDEASAAAARLELAEAYENAQDRRRAESTLRKAVAARPTDPVPLERLADLYLRARDWRGAVDALRAWERVVGDPVARSGLHLRIGVLLRDHAYDLPEAAVSFRQAAELDPLGDGTWQLAQLHESGGDEAGRMAVLEHAIVEVRRALQEDPLDLARLHRLRELLAATDRDGSRREADRPVAQILALLGELPADDDGLDPTRGAVSGVRGGPALTRAISGAFWNRLAPPAALGFMAEIWALLADAVLELYPANPSELGALRQNRLTPGSQPGLAWVEASAAALGLPPLLLHRSLHPTARDTGAVQAVELPAPGLVFGEAAIAGGGAAPFWFGRALALLRARATAVVRLSPVELQTLFVASGLVAGAPAIGGNDTPAVTRSAEAQAKALGKALARKERKALALQASRFGFERIDAEPWQQAIGRAADRLGLLMGGDVAGAARALGDFSGAVSAADLRRQPAVLDLLRFSLGESYLTLRQEAGLARD
jgi:hypothetical protein